MTLGSRSGQEDHVSVSTTCLDLSEIAAIVADPRAGATSTFSGTTRDNHFGEKLTQAGRISRTKLRKMKKGKRERVKGRLVLAQPRDPVPLADATRTQQHNSAVLRLLRTACGLFCPRHR